MSQEDLDEEIRKGEIELHQIFVDMMRRFIKENHLKHSTPKEIAIAYHRFSHQILGPINRRKKIQPDKDLVDLADEALRTFITTTCRV